MADFFAKFTAEQKARRKTEKRVRLSYGPEGGQVGCYWFSGILLRVQ